MRVLFSLVSLPAFAFAGHVISMNQVPTSKPAVLVEVAVFAEGDINYDVQRTPFEGLYDSVLNVIDNASGKTLPYKGKVARRWAGLNSAVHIEDGGHITHVVDLVGSYDMESFGSYTVEFDSAKTIVQVGDLSNATFVDPMNLACTSTELSQASTAQSQAGTQVSRARSSLNGGAGSLYVEWFGTSTSTRFNKIVGDFSAISSNLSRSRYACDRTCPGVYAYVYPSDTSQTIYLCDVFWQLPSERAETIVHEVSHFTRIAGTDDWTYGQTNCRNLARTNPDRAVDNADNQCYFGKYA